MNNSAFSIRGSAASSGDRPGSQSPSTRKRPRLRSPLFIASRWLRRSSLPGVVYAANHFRFFPSEHTSCWPHRRQFQAQLCGRVRGPTLHRHRPRRRRFDPWCSWCRSGPGLSTEPRSLPRVALSTLASPESLRYSCRVACCYRRRCTALGVGYALGSTSSPPPLRLQQQKTPVMSGTAAGHGIRSPEWHGSARPLEHLRLGSRLCRSVPGGLPRSMSFGAYFELIERIGADRASFTAVARS